jgi:GDP-L-fucose synthase
MRLEDKIYVAGHRGLVGSAILRRLTAAGYVNLVTRTHAELDLIDQVAVRQFFEHEKPRHVFLAAAKVGGILANNTYPADFIFQNVMIQANAIYAAYVSGVEKLLFLGSSCIYPRLAPQPMKEEHLLTGLLEPTNEPYAVAKIAGIKMCAAYNRQYGTHFMAVMPTNLYGPCDNYDPHNSHVIAALIGKMHEAKTKAAPEVSIWGTGQPRREFLLSDDAADACVFLMERYDVADIGEFINIGSGCDVTIAELANLVRQVIGFEGELVFDPSKPDGTPRKLLDVTRMKRLGWAARTSLEEGIRRTYADYLTRCRESQIDVPAR